MLRLLKHTTSGEPKHPGAELLAFGRSFSGIKAPFHVSDLVSLLPKTLAFPCQRLFLAVPDHPHWKQPSLVGMTARLLNRPSMVVVSVFFRILMHGNNKCTGSV